MLFTEDRLGTWLRSRTIFIILGDGGGERENNQRTSGNFHRQCPLACKKSKRSARSCKGGAVTISARKSLRFACKLNYSHTSATHFLNHLPSLDCVPALVHCSKKEKEQPLWCLLCLLMEGKNKTKFIFEELSSLLLLLVILCFACMCVCAPCSCSVYGGQQRASDP